MLGLCKDIFNIVYSIAACADSLYEEEKSEWEGEKDVYIGFMTVRQQTKT